MANYRIYFDSLPAPKIPFLGISLQDLTHLHDANPNRDPKNKNLINFSKWFKLGCVVEKLVRIQHTPYDFRPLQPLINYLLSACGFENHENAAYKFSLLIEPDDQRETPLHITFPTILSESIQGLYSSININVTESSSSNQSNHSNLFSSSSSPSRPLIEEPEIQLLNQRSKLILQNFQVSLEPDRTAFWKSLVEKLAASSSKRVIISTNSFKDLNASPCNLIHLNSDLDCLTYREILCKSFVIEGSIESALISFPSESNQLNLFISLLKATLRSFVDVDKLIQSIQELASCRLVPEFRSVIVDLISCYKDMEIQSRHNKISSASRSLTRLQHKRKDIIEINDSLSTIDSLNYEIRFTSESIQHMYIQQQLLREKRIEYENLFAKYNQQAVIDLCEFLEDSTKNINLRISRKKEKKQNAIDSHSRKISELQKQKEDEEIHLKQLLEEEKKLLLQLEKIDKNSGRLSSNLKTFHFYRENASVCENVDSLYSIQGDLPRKTVSILIQFNFYTVNINRKCN